MFRTPTGLMPLAIRAGIERWAMNAVRIPIFAASARRRSDCETGRISPPRPTSPRKMDSAARGRSYTLDASAAATARSPPARSIAHRRRHSGTRRAAKMKGPRACREQRGGERVSDCRIQLLLVAEFRSRTSLRAPESRSAPVGCLRGEPSLHCPMHDSPCPRETAPTDSRPGRVLPRSS